MLGSENVYEEVPQVHLLAFQAPLINWIPRLQIEDFPTNRETSELDLSCALGEQFGSVTDV